MIKIIGGKYKKSNLVVPKKNVRPTSSVKREAIFSVIESYALKNSINLYKKKGVLDIFAGSGSLGLEAISRGIEEAIFYENNPDVVKTLISNCNKICKNEKYQVIEKDVMLGDLEKNSLSVSIIFIDPPYNKYDISKLINKLIIKKIIEDNTILIFETSINHEVKFDKKLIIFNKKSFGKTSIYFLKLST